MISARRFLFNAATFIPGVASLPPVRRVFQRHSLGTPTVDPIGEVEGLVQQAVIRHDA